MIVRIAAAVFGAMVCAWAWGLPPAFVGMEYDEALAESERAGRLLVVDMTAEWCGPCKAMDKDTWSHVRVVEWMREHAVAVQIDVDEERETSRALRVRAMPTVIVFVDGAEFDRVVGYQGPDALLSWLDGVREGRTHVDAMLAIAGDRVGPDGHVHVQTRLDLARRLLDAGRHTEATEEFVWLWEHMLEFDQAYYGVRLSFMASDIERLTEEHAPARERFVVFRDAMEERLRAGEASMLDLGEWLTLNAMVHDTARTLEWFDRVKDRPDGADTIEFHVHTLKELLIERGRWADVGRLWRDPVGDVRASIAQMRTMEDMRAFFNEGEFDEEKEEELASSLNDWMIGKGATVYVACLAAGRRDEAGEIAGVLIESFDGAAARAEMVRHALRADVADTSHRAMLDEAAALGGDVNELRAQLEKTLTTSDPD